MKSEKAEAYINSHAKRAEECCCEVSTYIGKIVLPVVQVINAVELAEQDAEERVRRELTRWHDPKEEQPENNVCVLIKVADKFGNSAIYLGSREGNEYLTDGGFEFEIDCNDESSSEMKVVGWREIL